MMDLISIVVPVYYGQHLVKELTARIAEAMKDIPSVGYEVILVNDGSPDSSWQAIEEVCLGNPTIKGLNLSRNFGQHYAITAGLEYARGEWVVVMDCDLQDDPREILRLYNKALEGWDMVFAQRLERKDSWRKRLSSRVFHAVFQYLSDIRTDASVGNFGIYHQKVIVAYRGMPERARSFGSLLEFVGFRRAYLPVVHQPRLVGKSTYTLGKLLALAGDVILTNSNKPLKLTAWMGLFISCCAFALAAYNLVAYYRGLILVPGFTTTVFSIWFVGGLLLLVLGIMGLYIGKIFDQVKGRPMYIISEKINL